MKQLISQFLHTKIALHFISFLIFIPKGLFQ